MNRNGFPVLPDEQMTQQLDPVVRQELAKPGINEGSSWDANLAQRGPEAYGPGDGDDAAEPELTQADRILLNDLAGRDHNDISVTDSRTKLHQ